MIDLEVGVVEEKEIIEEINVVEGTRSLPAGSWSYSNSSGLRDFILNNYDGGNTLYGIYIEDVISQGYSGYQIYFNLVGNIESRCILFIPYDYSNYGEMVSINGSSFVKLNLFNSTDDCIGLNLITGSLKSNTSLEIIPKTGVSVDIPSVSGNGIDYTDLLKSIDYRMERIEQNVESISNNVIFIRDGINDFPGGEAGSVTLSENSIMDKYISDYSVSEALLLFISISILIAGIVVIIKKGVPIWH